MTERRLPVLRVDIPKLYEVLTTKMFMTTKDIAESFGISIVTARRIMREVEQVDNLTPSTTTVDAIFSLYGWNPDDVVKKYKLMREAKT